MVDLLDGSESFGDEVKWWIGMVAPRSAWADGANYDNDKEVGDQKNKGEYRIKYGQVKVRVVGYHDQIKNPNDLPWATVGGSPQMANGYGFMDKNHMLRGGESVYGIWLDGEDEQKPHIVGVFYRHYEAEDTAPPATGFSIPAAHASTLDQTPTGNTASTNVATGDKTPEVRYSKRSNRFDPITGRLLTEKPSKYPVINQESSKKGSAPKGVGQDALIQGSILAEAKTEKPSCKRDNAVGALTGLLGDFAELLYGAQEYANFYVNGVTGVIQDFQNDINLIAKSMTAIMEGMFNGVRNWIFAEVGKRVKEFLHNIMPEEVKPIFGLSLKEITDTIYCIFENLIKSLFNTILDFLLALVGKFINAPICAAEEFIGSLLNNLSSGINEAVSPILNSLSETLGGALGSVNGIIDKALGYIGLLYNFIGCDQFKCPIPSRYDNTYGPSQKQRDNATKVFKGLSALNIPTAWDKDGNPKQTLGGFLNEAKENTSNGSIFKLSETDKKTAAEVAALVGGCETQVLRCGPPKVEIFGGDGIGGVGRAVVSNLGAIIGVDVLERGLGYSVDKPPYVTFRDACGNGAGARGRAEIGDDGGIDRIIIDYTGYGYLNNQGDTITTSGTIPGTPVQGDPVTGVIDTVIVTNPGFGYNPDDTFNIPGLEPVVIGGSVVSVKVTDSGFFTDLPDLEINSETGIGAAFVPVLKFKKVGELSKPLDPAKVITIVDCISR